MHITKKNLQKGLSRIFGACAIAAAVGGVASGAIVAATAQANTTPAKDTTSITSVVQNQQHAKTKVAAYGGYDDYEYWGGQPWAYGTGG